MGREGFVKLESILNSYNLILPDTCVIVSSIEEAVSGVKNSLRSLTFWKNYLDNNPNSNKILFCEDICKELKKGSKIKSNKRTCRKYKEGGGGFYPTKHFKRFAKRTIFTYNRKKALLEIASNEKHILKFNEQEEESFLDLYNKYILFLSSGIIKKAGYSLVISSLDLSKTRCGKGKKLAFISNNYPLIEIGKTLLRLNPDIKETMHLYKRIKFDGFLRERF